MRFASLKRTPLKRSTTRIRQTAAKKRRGPMRNQQYKNFLKKNCMCVVCVKLFKAGTPFRGWMDFIVDPAHTENNGMSSKGPDSSCAPLCRHHHDAYDAGRRAFEIKYGVDMTEEAKVHYALFLSLDANH